MKRITKKEFKKYCSFHLYSGIYPNSTKTNIIYYDWKSDFSKDKHIVGFKYAVAANRTELSKKKLLDVLYDWAVNEVQPPFYVRYKYAMTDEQRFKVGLSLNW